MHRFRVRSKSQSEGSKRSGSEAPPPTATMTAKLEPLPPESDFRTSLIMPSLSRRFTLLRGQNGEPLSIDDVRTRLAHQRANGHVNHVTEEEEEIMIDALIRAHSIDPTASASDSDGYTTATANDGYSTANTNTNDSYASGYDSPQSYGGYRPRNMSTSRKGTLSTSSGRETYDSTKQGNGDSLANGISFDTYLSNSSFSPAQIRRASLALQDAIQEFEEEEEEDEKILAPRKGDQQQREHDSHAGDSPVGYGEAIAWPNDQSKQSSHDPMSSSAPAPYHSSGTSSPNYRMDTVNRLPGYVPGMHRPITPRDSGVDTDTNTGTSTSQTASNTSTPGYEYGSNVSSPGRPERPLPQSILLNKRASTNSSPLRTRPRELSNPDQYDGGGSSSDTTQVPLKSALSDKRRPTSPLVDSAYQSAIRASTPSNHFVETWSPNGVSFATHSPPHMANSSSMRGTHMREISNVNSAAESSDTYYSNPSQSRSAASPALPDSPTINGSTSNSGLANIMSSSWSGATTNVIVDEPIHRTSTPRLSTLENGYSRGVRPYSPHMRAGTPNAQTRRAGGHSRNGSLADTAISTGRRSPRTSQPHASSAATRPNPLMMSPMLNSSRSSLASTGSSYHSWDEDQLGGKKPHKRGVSVFIDNDSAQWRKHHNGFDANLGAETAPEPEHIRDVLAGLTVQDMIAVQNKLVSAAVKKRVSVPGVRPLSGPRRRRVSAGQSVTSLASPTEPEAASPVRVASPPPVTQTPPPNPILTPPPLPPATPPASKSAEDQAKKANALLHAMMDSIESSPHKPSTPPVTAPSSVLSPSPQPQALAPQTSFSSEEPQSTTPPSPEDEPPTPDTPVPEQDPRQKALADALFGSDSDATVKDPNPGFGRSQSLRAFAMPPVSSSPPTDPDASPVQGKSPQDEKLLVEDVERRAMAATAALKSASTHRLNETNGRKPGKKVNPKQISSPQLVSATRSMDTFGLAAGAAAAAAGSNPPTPQQIPQTLPPHTQSKLSQRIKKFTGNLRTRAPIPTGDEISPYVIEASTPSSTEPAQPSPSNRIPSASTGASLRVPSNSESKSTPPAAESPVCAPSTPDGSAPSSVGTPTSPQPRLRGFMARLRKGRKDSTSSGFGDKPRAPSPLGPNPSKTIPAPPHIPAAMLKLEPVPMPANLSTSSLAGSGTGVEAPPPPPPPPPAAPQSAPADLVTAPTHTSASPQQMDEEAIRQLYSAASQLGLDHSAISDILVRSQSTSSRSTGWTQASSPMAPSSHTADTVTTPPLPSVLERSASVTTPKLPRSTTALGRQLSLKPYNGLPLRPPPSKEDTPSASIVRRTVIFPTPPGRASSEMSRRPSSRHRRNRSGSIHSNKSVQERAPTPPPSRAPINKRFSKDASPPVPQLPTGIEGSATSVLLASRSGSAFSNNNYDSLYEMYAEESQPGSEEQPPTGSAVEVIEFSDGQVVWSVVDGLRSVDDDYEEDDSSPFPRISRTSEYSAHETHQLRFREHQRSASKTSTASKASNEPTPKRPETRVYFSNAGDIGTLIDSLTKSHEAGQFNIVPGVPGVPGSLGHLRAVSGSVSGPSQSGSLSVQSGSISANSFNSSYNSDGDLTLEERLEQMITASRKRAGL